MTPRGSTNASVPPEPHRRKDEKGASAVEYGLLVAAIAALIVIIVFALGGIVKDVFPDTCNEISSGASS